MAAICGIDWAAEFHDVRIADEHGSPPLERRFEHSEAGLDGLIRLLLARRVELVAIERPDGLLVGRLLAAGIAVMAIHPNQVAAARDRYRAAAGKSDRFDAMVLCELARTDRHRFQLIAPCSDETLALRSLMRTREDLVDARVALANQLRTQLDAFWPGAKQIFADVDSKIGLAFLATRVASGPSASPASSPATATAVADPRPSCSSACAARRSPPSANSSRTPAAPPSSASSPRSDRSSSRSPN
jgi:hypothetical protein